MNFHGSGKCFEKHQISFNWKYIFIPLQPPRNFLIFLLLIHMSHVPVQDIVNDVNEFRKSWVMSVSVSFHSCHAARVNFWNSSRKVYFMGNAGWCELGVKLCCLHQDKVEIFPWTWKQDDDASQPFAGIRVYYPTFFCKAMQMYTVLISFFDVRELFLNLWPVLNPLGIAFSTHPLINASRNSHTRSK